MAQTADGRHFELISAPIVTSDYVTAMFPDTSTDGSSVVYSAVDAQPFSVQGSYDATFVARRGASGWTSYDASLPASAGGPNLHQESRVTIVPPNADQLLVQANGQPDPTAPVIDEVRGRAYVMTPGETTGRALIRPPFSDALLYPLARQSTVASVFFRSSGGSGVNPVADDGTTLTPDQIGRQDANGLTVASRLPGGDLPDEQSAVQAPTDVATYNGSLPKSGVSADGRRLYFTAWIGAARQSQPRDLQYGPLQSLFLHDGDETVAVSRSEIDGETKVGRFIGSSRDDGVAYFISNESLDGGHTGGGVYRWTPASANPERITPSVPGATIDDLKISRGAVSRDGSTVAFTSPAILAPGAQQDEDNAYVWQDGSLRYIGNIGADGEITNLSEDGRYLVLRSSAGLRGAATGGFGQVFRYEPADKRLLCVSCRPDGSPNEGLSGFGPTPAINVGLPSGTEPRGVSDDGRVFFTARDRLLPEDRTQGGDVYEFDGTGLRLLTDGEGKSYVVDNSDDGSSVYIISSSSLTPEDADNGYLDLFVRRTGSDFPRSGPSAQCTGDGCQGAAPAASGGPSAGSQRSTAADNARPERRLAAALLGRPALSASARRALARGRAATVRIRLRGEGRLSVRGTARVGSKRRVVLTGTGTSRKSSTRTATVVVRLNGTGRNELRRTGRLSVRLEVTFGSAAKRTATVDLRRAGR